jgi:uncharacterized protein
MSTKKTAAQVLKEARLKAGFTQAELAEKSGVYVNTIAKIERGEQYPQFPTLKSLARALGISTDDVPAE